MLGVLECHLWEREREKRELYPMMVIKSNHFLTINLKKNAVPIYIYIINKTFQNLGVIYIYIYIYPCLMCFFQSYHYFSFRDGIICFSFLHVKYLLCIEYKTNNSLYTFSLFLSLLFLVSLSQLIHSVHQEPYS